MDSFSSLYMHLGDARMITLSRSGNIKMRLHENDLHKIHINFNGELFLNKNLTSPKYVFEILFNTIRTNFCDLHAG
jgi:hypothetical protein